MILSRPDLRRLVTGCFLTGALVCGIALAALAQALWHRLLEGSWRGGV
jgi:hypothetical protein